MAGKRVLTVDDSPTMRRIIVNSLKKIGFEDIIEAEHGLEGLEKLASNEVDLIITDWNMPEMNGEQFVKSLRDNDKYKDTPIIMITTRGMKDDVLTAVKMGVNGYVVKPFTPEILKQKLSTVIDI
ncbi:MAG: response regulator [Candidatus Marinimicrobia bacterium]|nr:response regulator [Candidatus Neomarinimicrobiota bacterium]